MSKKKEGGMKGKKKVLQTPFVSQKEYGRMVDGVYADLERRREINAAKLRIVKSLQEAMGAALEAGFLSASLQERASAVTESCASLQVFVTELPYASVERATLRPEPARFKAAMESLHEQTHKDAKRCVVCGCTEGNCGGCIERTGTRCSWDYYVTRHDVCTACSAIYYTATAKHRFVAALLGNMFDMRELYLSRDFAVRLGDVKRGNLLQGRIDHLKSADFDERRKAVVK